MATSNEAQDVVWFKYCLQYVAEYYCGDCRDKMCQTCKNSHKGHPHFLNHVIVTYHEREAAVKPWDVKNAVFQYVPSVK